jgi:hypothetical protein
MRGVSSSPEAAAIVDMPALLDVSGKEARSALGAPSECDVSKKGETCRYRFKERDVELYFQRGASASVTVSGVDEHFGSSSLPVFGIRERTLTTATPIVIRADTTVRGKAAAVSMFPRKDNRVDYVYLKKATLNKK